MNRTVSITPYGEENFDDFLTITTEAIIHKVSAITRREPTHPISTAELCQKTANANLYQLWIADKRFNRWNTSYEYLLKLEVGNNYESIWFADYQVQNVTEPAKKILTEKVIRFNTLIRALGICTENEMDFSYLTAPMSLMPDYFLKDVQNHEDSCRLVIETVYQQYFANEENSDGSI